MKKYRWSLLKTLEFLNSRRPDLEIRATFIHQLSAYEQRLQSQRDIAPITSKWDELSHHHQMKGTRLFEHEELILRNTFVNAQMGPLADFRSHLQGPNQERPVKLKWIDNGENDKNKLRTNNSEDDLVCQEEPKVMDFHRRQDKRPRKATIKPFKQTISEVTGVPPLS
jgi:hypothetical protein